MSTGLVSDRITGAEASMAIKAPVRVATTENITLSGEQTIDGVSVVSEDRVLVKDQTDTTKNGIYVCQTGAWYRAKDMDGARDILLGTFVYVQEGAVSAGRDYRLTTADPVIDTTALSFAEIGRDGVLDYTTYAAAEAADTGDASYILVAGALYIYDASGTALTTGDGRKWSPAGSTATLAQFGAVGDDATDDTAAIQVAFDWMSGDPGRIVLAEGEKTYLTTSPITTTGHVNINWGASKIHANHNDRIISANAGATEYALSADYTKEALTIAVASTGTALSANTYIKVGSNSVDPGNRDGGSGLSQYRTAEWATAADGTTATSIALVEPLRFVRGIDTTSIPGDEAREDAYTTANNARIFVPNSKSFKMVGGEFYYTDGQEATWSGAAILLRWYNRPVFKEVKITRGYGAGIQLNGTQAAEVTRCTFSRLENNTGNGQYGYAVADAGYMTNVTDCVFIDCRHGYTTNASNHSVDYSVTSAASVGRIVGARISNCRGYDFNGGSPFDTHLGAEDVTFAHCIAERCTGYGFTARGRNIHLNTPVVRNGGLGIYMYTEYDSGDPDEDFFTAGKTQDDFTWGYIVNSDIQCEGIPYTFGHARVIVDGTFRARSTTHQFISMSGNVTWNASGRFTTTNFDTARSYSGTNNTGVIDVSDVNAAASAVFSSSSILFGKGANVFNVVGNATATGITGVRVDANSNATKRGRVTFELPSGASVLGGTLANIDWTRDGRVNVEDFGARGDNSTDCTAAIQEALDYAGTRGTLVLNKAGRGSVVHIPEGVWQVNGSLNILTSAVIVRGAGPNVTLVRQLDETSDIFVFAGADPFNTGNADAIAARPENVGIDGIGTYIDQSDISNALTSKHVVFRRALGFVTNCKFRGYHTAVAMYGTAEGCRIEGNYFASTRGSGVTSQKTDDCHILVGLQQVDPTDALALVGGDGNYYDRPVGLYVSNNQMKDPSGAYGVYDGIRVEAIDGLYATNNHFGFGARSSVALVSPKSIGTLNCVFHGNFLDLSDAVSGGPSDYAIYAADSGGYGAALNNTVFTSTRLNVGATAGVYLDRPSLNGFIMSDFIMNRAFATSGSRGVWIRHGEYITVSNGSFGSVTAGFYVLIDDDATISNVTLDNLRGRDYNGSSTDGDSSEGIRVNKAFDGLQITNCDMRDCTNIPILVKGGSASTDFFVRDCKGEGSNQLASAGTIYLPAWTDIVNITGTTNVANIGSTTAAQSAWEGREVTLVSTGVQTYQASGNMGLKSNFTTAAGSVLKVAYINGAWTEIARQA